MVLQLLVYAWGTAVNKRVDNLYMTVTLIGDMYLGVEHQLQSNIDRLI